MAGRSAKKEFKMSRKPKKIRKALQEKSFSSPKLDKKSGKILIDTSASIGVHKRSVIRPKGGGEIPLDDFKHKVKGAHVKAVGIKNTGWHLPDSEFIEHGNSYGTVLPAYGSREGVTRQVVAVVDEKRKKRVVFKFPLFGWTASNLPDMMIEHEDIARKIHKTVPAAKMLKVRKVPNLEFLDKNPFSEGIMVEEHELVCSHRNKDGRLISKNLHEEHFDHPIELIDSLRQITESVTKLYTKAGILYTDTKPENFVRDCCNKTKKHPHGVVKIVDHEAQYRSLEREDIKQLGRALAVPVNDLSERNKHLFEKNPNLKKELVETVHEAIKKNIRTDYERNRMMKYFKKYLRIRRI